MYRFQIVWGLRPGPCLGKFLCVQSSESHILDVQKPPHGEWLTLPERMLFVILVEQAEGEGDHPSLSRAELGKRGIRKEVCLHHRLPTGWVGVGHTLTAHISRLSC